MYKSNIINIQWIAVYILYSLSFGASIPEVTAIEVAHNVYIEHKDLHGGDEFIISTI